MTAGPLPLVAFGQQNEWMLKQARMSFAVFCNANAESMLWQVRRLSAPTCPADSGFGQSLSLHLFSRKKRIVYAMRQLNHAMRHPSYLGQYAVTMYPGGRHSNWGKTLQLI